MSEAPAEKGLTPQREKFAQGIVEGLNQSDAYRAAFPKSLKLKDKSVNEMASKLAADIKVISRIEELRAPVIAKAQLSKQWVLDNLKTVAERCMQAAPVLGRKGEPVFVETPAGTLVPAFTFDPAGANKSLELIGKELKMFIDRVETGNPGDFADLDDDQLTRAAEAADAAIARASGSQTSDKAGNTPKARNKQV